MSLTRRSFLIKAAAAAAIGPAIVASSGPSALLSTAYAESAEHSDGSRGYLKLTPRSKRRKVETDHTLTARISPAIADVTIEFLVMFGPNAGITGPALTDEDGVASFTYTGGADEGSDFILAWIDDGSAEFERHEPFGLALVHWQLTHPIDKLLASPRGGESEIGTEHTITAVVIPPASGVPIIFTIVTGPHAGLSETVETADNGTASFSYTGTTEGKDTIAILADANSSGAADEGERLVILKREWVIELPEDQSGEESSNGSDEADDHDDHDDHAKGSDEHDISFSGNREWKHRD